MRNFGTISMGKVCRRGISSRPTFSRKGVECEQQQRVEETEQRAEKGGPALGCRERPCSLAAHCCKTFRANANAEIGKAKRIGWRRHHGRYFDSEIIAKQSEGKPKNYEISFVRKVFRRFHCERERKKCINFACTQPRSRSVRCSETVWRETRRKYNGYSEKRLALCLNTFREYSHIRAVAA